MAKPILCLDFDGVLSDYRSGWHGPADIPDGPVKGAEIALASYLEHFQVVVFSVRSQHEEGRVAMRNWCRRHFGIDIAEQIQFPRSKPPAFLYLDDRALCFRGVWPDAQSMLAFQTWTQDKTLPWPDGERRMLCPDCGTALVKTHIEQTPDGEEPFWLTCWTCDCKPPAALLEGGAPDGQD